MAATLHTIGVVILPLLKQPPMFKARVRLLRLKVVPVSYAQPPVCVQRERERERERERVRVLGLGLKGKGVGVRV